MTGDRNRLSSAIQAGIRGTPFEFGKRSSLFLRTVCLYVCVRGRGIYCPDDIEDIVMCSVYRNLVSNCSFLFDVPSHRICKASQRLLGQRRMHVRL